VESNTYRADSSNGGLQSGVFLHRRAALVLRGGIEAALDATPTRTTHNTTGPGEVPQSPRR